MAHHDCCAGIKPRDENLFSGKPSADGVYSLYYSVTNFFDPLDQSPTALTTGLGGNKDLMVAYLNKRTPSIEHTFEDAPIFDIELSAEDSDTHNCIHLNVTSKCIKILIDSKGGSNWEPFATWTSCGFKMRTFDHYQGLLKFTKKPTPKDKKEALTFLKANLTEAFAGMGTSIAITIVDTE